ncbi:MAG TPA: hypothetical protein VFN56_03095 [Candidatus Saccharimonadales bacterium]|nr:hypothetical protein [Candidatus Saccharimonadales bacterium]
MILKKIKTIALAIVALGTIGFSSNHLATIPAYAASTDLKGDACAGLDTFSGNASGSSCNTGSASNGVSDLVTTIVKILSWAVGIAAIIMIIIAGFNFVTSGGSSEKVGTAKKTLLYAIAGIVIVVLAQFIVYFTVKASQNQCPSSSSPKTSFNSASCKQ